MDDSFFGDTPIFFWTVQWSPSYWALSWRCCLSIAALLDFLATVLPDIMRETVDDPSGNNKSHAIITQQNFVLFGKSIPDFPFGQTLRWLDDNVAYIGLLFSILCFVEAFLDAKRSRDRVVIKHDRKKILSKAINDDTEDSINLVDDLGYLEDDFGSSMTFYLSLLQQLMLLPTGFYRGLAFGAEAELGVAQQNNKGTIIKKILQRTYDVDQYENSSLLSKQATTMSLGFAIVSYFVNTVLTNTRISAEALIHKRIISLAKRLTRRAIRNPRQFGWRVKKALTVARWVKYIHPIFGAANKLKGNLVELTKKYRQRHRARVAQRIRQILFRQMTANERREYAARRIQSTYRSYRTRKVIWALNIIQGNKETFAAIKVQAVFRAKLAQARKRIKRKRLELKKLQAKARKDLHLKKGEKSMNAEERKRLYELEEELQMETARILNRRMLLRPDTIFSIAWKAIFVLCVIVEIAGLVWNPILKKYKDKDTGESLTVSDVLKNYMVPPPLSNVCFCGVEDLGYGIQWLKKVLEALKLQKPKQCGPKPWFCNAPYSTAISCYSRFMAFLMDEFLVMVSIVMAVDVPISFFTGEFNEETGVLQPKSWFHRWILPGLVLQLAVNPHLASTSRALGRILDQIFHHIGPVRVFRWASALFYPLFLVTLDFLERHVWVHIISDLDDRNNDHISVLDEATSLVLQKQPDLQVTVKMLST